MNSKNFTLTRSKKNHYIGKCQTHIELLRSLTDQMIQYHLAIFHFWVALGSNILKEWQWGSVLHSQDWLELSAEQTSRHKYILPGDKTRWIIQNLPCCSSQCRKKKLAFGPRESLTFRSEYLSHTTDSVRVRCDSAPPWDSGNTFL